METENANMLNENHAAAGNTAADREAAVVDAANTAVSQQGAENETGVSGQETGGNAAAQPAATPMIKNPLPLPTPHTNRKEVDYDYEVPEDQMHFDIEKPSRNYYDIQ